MSGCSFCGKFFAVVTAVFLTLGLVGCEEGGKGNPAGGNDGKLVLGEGEAWVVCNEDECSGWIFKENGDVITVGYNEDLDVWVGLSLLNTTYTVNKDTLTISMLGKPGDVNTYKISGNVLTLTNADGEITSFTKRSGLNITFLGGDSDKNLVVGDNEAWSGCFHDEEDDYDYCEGIIFKEDGKFMVADYDESDDVYHVWPMNVSTYSVKNDTLIVYIFGVIPVFSTYSISGNTLTVTDSDGDVRVYTKTSGLTIIMDNFDFDMLSKSPKAKKPPSLLKSLKTQKIPTFFGKTLGKIAQK